MKRFLPAFCALLLMAGCGMSDRMSQSVFGEKPALPDCPETGTLPDSGVFPVFKGEGDELSATGRVLGVSGTCSAEHPGVIDMEIKIGFGVLKNDPAFAPKKMALPYFIAILSPDEQVLQRQSFSTKVDFDNADSAASAEEHDLRIPVASKEAAAGYKVVVGFELSPGQLAHNRKGKEK